LKRKASEFALQDKALLHSMLAYMFLCEHILVTQLGKTFTC
jgi:hypothetical protein